MGRLYFAAILIAILLQEIQCKKSNNIHLAVGNDGQSKTTENCTKAFELVQQLQSTYATTLKELNQANQQLELQVSDLATSTEHQQNEIQQLKHQNVELENQLQYISIDTTNNSAVMEKQSDVCGDGSFVAFFARPYDTHEYASGTPIMFEDVNLNCGNAYDPITNVFTCPISGFYSFSVTLSTGPDNFDMHRIDGELHVGDTFVAKAVASYSTTTHDNTYYTTQGTISSVYRCEADDQVLVIAAVYEVNTARALGTRHSSFSGFLLVAD